MLIKQGYVWNAIQAYYAYLFSMCNVQSMLRLLKWPTILAKTSSLQQHALNLTFNFHLTNEPEVILAILTSPSWLIIWSTTKNQEHLKLMY